MTVNFDSYRTDLSVSHFFVPISNYSLVETKRPSRYHSTNKYTCSLFFDKQLTIERESFINVKS